MAIDRNAAAVVDDGDGIVFVNGDVYFVRVAGHRFVDGVVHDFPDEVMQTHFAGRADVHRGTQAHGFKSAEHFNGFCVVLMSACRFADNVFLIAHFFSLSANPVQSKTLRACGARKTNCELQVERNGSINFLEARKGVRADYSVRPSGTAAMRRVPYPLIPETGWIASDPRWAVRNS